MHTVMGKKTAPNSEKDAALKMDAGTMNSGLVSQRTAFYLFCQVQSLKLIKCVPFFFPQNMEICWSVAACSTVAEIKTKIRATAQVLPSLIWLDD